MTDVRLLTANEAAAILRCSQRTVVRHIEAGLLPGQKVGGTRWVLPADEIEAIAANVRAARIAELEALLAEAS